MLDQCGSKSEARWPGEREKVTTTQKFRQVPAVLAKVWQSSDQTVQTLNACLPWAAGVLGVVAGMLDQCGSKSDDRWPGEREKVTTTQKFLQVLQVLQVLAGYFF